VTPLLSDENLHGAIIRGLRMHLPGCNLVTAKEAGLLGEDDPTILAWAAAHGRLVVASDKQTMPGFAYDRLRAGQRMPGLIIIPQRLPLGDVIADLTFISECLTPDEWESQVKYLPLR